MQTWEHNSKHHEGCFSDGPHSTTFGEYIETYSSNLEPQELIPDTFYQCQNSIGHAS